MFSHIPCNTHSHKTHILHYNAVDYHMILHTPGIPWLAYGRPGPWIESHNFLEYFEFLKRIFHYLLLRNGCSEILNEYIAILKLDFVGPNKHFPHQRCWKDESLNFSAVCYIFWFPQTFIKPLLDLEAGGFP